MLLLTTTGRRTGKTRVIPIRYYRDGENYVLIASNWARDYHPGWYYNLLSQPEAEIQVRTRRLRVRAHVAASEERDRLWKAVTRRSPYYLKYQQKTRRKIPVVVLTSI